jgi:cyclohexanone monooxygenase
LRESWAEGPVTLHGMHTRGYPNLLLFNPTQSGRAINFVHVLDEQSQHAAYIIARCLSQDIVTIEPTEAAQEEWWGVIVGTLMKRPVTLGGPECTPGYYNNEGVFSPQLVRFAAYNGDTLEFFEVLRRWREADELAGLETTHGRGAP